ncbi:Gfo/Idh/MocA family protein [Tautonia sociabilis]|uniref:Gfo/Idh/MocA family oxidoreductase n=1 Tax=Tautonia sociabilis TaxID=2080755 RepID=A0A432MKB2_9BACT|nr:Gfo/Idh/MocA family oxidoreductase [Tautonia sociabilis]RUL87854.1 Gfo/Idh/MocA family oxidoreductase [Tautonia sociabilis]
MKPIPRRSFLRGSMSAGLALGMPRLTISAGARPNSPNETVNVAVLGLGSTTAVGGVGGRGHQLIGRLREIPGVRIVALCDADQEHLDRELDAAGKHGETVSSHRDLREVLDRTDVDAVVIALPNHWHALATIWACQAGKDVYIEKPFSYDLWEGRQMVAAARKYGRMVQVGTQRRSSPFLRGVIDRLNLGELGSIRFAHALVYRPRDGIGTVDAPTPPPATVDYDLWCGPAPKGPLRRKQLHYEWHWFWDTGNGELGNNGIHVIDVCRWALGQDRTPPRAMSIGGRFAFRDCGETANTQIALLDYQPAPLLCEVRNVSAGNRPFSTGKFRGLNGGIVIDCEEGYFAGDSGGGAFYDHQGKKIEDLEGGDNAGAIERAHLSSFLDAIRSRATGDLTAEAIEGHRSTACCHMGNVSHRLGEQANLEAIRAATSGNTELADAFERCRAYLSENGVDLADTPATLGPWVRFDEEQGRFVGDLADAANALSRRDYREPFVVPDLTGG